MIGIIGAMDEEVEQLVEVMEITREETKACMTFKAGKLAGKDVVIVRSGIGKVNAAACTQILVDDFKADYIIIQESLVHLRQRLILRMLLFHQMFFIMTWMRQDLDIL